ncbi:hypothetical protein JCM24511_06760 [Saitozyma sp. JCM 24511]|nr:hypothetical protein JCM24511_06760 [Saitozyma sp. JCM 24511]
MDISTALTALEQLASSTSTSSSGPLNALLDEHFSLARQRLLSGDEDPRVVITDLQKSVVKAKKDVEKGLKAWYAGLGNVGKAVEKAFPPNLATISSAYNDPPLFSEPAAKDALDRIVMDSLGRRGLWEAVSAMQDETGLTYDGEKRVLSEELHRIIQEIESGDVSSALEWCSANAAYLQSPPHPSPLPYHLHRSVFLRIASPTDALAYARVHLMPYLPSQPVLQLITSCLYRPGSSPYMHDTSPLVVMFRAEYCRRHGLAKDEPLEVVVDLGSRGGALNVIEKARRVMGDRLGNVRSWQELPMEVPLPPSRRYHSVFVCPVSKEQATDANPPKMLTCGHVIAQESFTRLLKGGRRSAKCPYCPMETSQQAAQRLYF